MVLLSVTIITKNEEKRIKRCLESLRWCKEIIISDSSSTDRTEEIATSYPNVRFFTDPWRGYGAQKNLAASRASHPWILNIDADEWCDEKLVKAIVRTLEKKPLHDAYSIVRKNYLAGKEVRFSGWGYEPIIRLYRKEETAFSEAKVHEGIEAASIGTITEGRLHHDGFDSREAFVKKHRHYAKLAAEEIAAKKRAISMIDIYGRPLFSFIKYYFLKAGFLDGSDGLFLAKTYAIYCYNKYTIAQQYINAQKGEKA